MADGEVLFLLRRKKDIFFLEVFKVFVVGGDEVINFTFRVYVDDIQQNCDCLLDTTKLFGS